MADSAAKVNQKTRARAGRSAHTIADGVTIYEGMLAGIQGGYLDHWADGTADVFAGLVIGGDSRANDGVIIGETSDTPAPEGYVDDSGLTLMHLDSVAGATAKTVTGDLVWSPTSNTDDITLTQPTTINTPIGWVSRWRSTTDVDITLFTPSEFLVQQTA